MPHLAQPINVWSLLKTRRGSVLWCYYLASSLPSISAIRCRKRTFEYLTQRPISDSEVSTRGSVMWIRQRRASATIPSRGTKIHARNITKSQIIPIRDALILHQRYQQDQHADVADHGQGCQKSLHCSTISQPRTPLIELDDEHRFALAVVDVFGHRCKTDRYSAFG